MSPVQPRRAAIADAGIRIIARDGVRALTHRAVDREAAIPQGSTSYYAKTRDALLDLIVDALAEHTSADAADTAITLDAATVGRTAGRPASVGDLARQLTHLVTALTSRRDDMRARYALILELDDDRMRRRLTTASDVHDQSRRIAAGALAGAGLPHSARDVDDLIAVTEALTFHRSVIDDTTDVERILTAYLRGSRDR